MYIFFSSVAIRRRTSIDDESEGGGEGKEEKEEAALVDHASVHYSNTISILATIIFTITITE